MTIVYKQEMKDGIGDLVASKASVSIASQLKLGGLSEEDFVKNLERSIAEMQIPNVKELFHSMDVDIYPIASIMVSTGWNKNDDVFLPNEIWAARKTPVYKRFNYEHVQNDIIGHIVASMILDENGEEYHEQEVPNSFDLAIAVVLYTYWTTPELQNRMLDIIENIRAGTGYVSMECLFPDFDYAVINNNTGEHLMVPRNNETAFLTKHLRAYGGNGVYEDYRVGRALKRFTFSGTGYVSNPANPRSVIFGEGDVNPFIAKANFNKIILENSMDKDINTLEKKIDELQSKLDNAEASLKDKHDKEVQAYKGQISELEKSVAALEAKNDALNEAINKYKKERDETAAILKEIEEQFATLTKEKVDATRRQKLVEAGFEGDKLEALVSKFSSFSDEQFEDVLAVYKDMKKPKKEEAKSFDLDNLNVDDDLSLSNNTDELDVQALAAHIRERMNNKGDK